MKNRVYEVEYSGHKVRYSFLYPGTRHHFRDYIRRAEGEEYDIRITPEKIEINRPQLPEDSSDSYVEYRVMITRTALELLRYGCSIFHSVAFVLEGRAFLLTAASGVGKTTQFLNWQRLHPGEIEMICGDMPVLDPMDDGSIIVSSTSWCGKENIGRRDLAAPLAGVVLLEQGAENVIAPLPPREALVPFLRQFVLRPETEEQCFAIAKLTEKLLLCAPVWKLVNLGDDASTEMLRETLINRVRELNGGGNDTL